LGMEWVMAREKVKVMEKVREMGKGQGQLR
jgi:hypothetical protein